jgi:hypothetical protein
MATNDGRGNGERDGAPSPRKEIFGIVERNEVSYWTRIGVAFENRDGSWNLRFDYLPSRPEVKVQLREPREPRERPEEARPPV